MKRTSRRGWLAAAGVALGVALAPTVLGALVTAARATVFTGAAVSAEGTVLTGATVTTVPAARHVVIVGISGLRWDLVTQTGTPELWRLAAGGSVGSLVDYAQQPTACPADGWLTLNAAARAQGPRPCTPLPEVTGVTGDGRGARVPALPRLIQDNQRFHESPNWGRLGSLARCATAVGPGAALALASPTGAVASYRPTLAGLSAAVLARCPLTVVDLGQVSAEAKDQISAPERTRVSAIDRQLAQLAAELPRDTLLLVTSPGTVAGGRPHLASLVVSGPGFGDGLLDSASTRQPGIVALTDLTPTVAGWLGRPVPAGTVGARIYRADRGDLAPTVRALIGRDTAEQVWLSTHGWFFIGYAVADAVAFAVPGLIYWGAEPERRRRRARSWRVAGTLAAAVPLGSYLANLVPWWRLAHPGGWLYGLTAAWSLLLAGVAWAGPWRREGHGPFGLLGLVSLGVLSIDVMTGSRLQLEAPFGLSLLTSGRFYGIGNDALGLYCVCALVGAAWLGMLTTRAPVLAAGAVGLVAVVASGWPGFGAKAGGTIALVPCLLLLLMVLGGVRVGWRLAAPIAISGLALFLVLAVVSYLFPAVGVSDLGTFAGNLLHGRGGGLLERKASANAGTLTVSVLGWLIPLVAAVTALALWRPAALRLRTLQQAFDVAPLVRAVLGLSWLVLVIGWLADDSGVIVPAAALPFAVPLAIALAASVSAAAGGARYILVPPQHQLPR
jgi:hypothetical protein